MGGDATEWRTADRAHPRRDGARAVPRVETPQSHTAPHHQSLLRVRAVPGRRRRGGQNSSSRYAAQLRRNATFRHYDSRYHITANLLQDAHRLPQLLAKSAGTLKDVTVGAAGFVTQPIAVLAVTFLLVLHGREYAVLGLAVQIILRDWSSARADTSVS